MEISSRGKMQKKKKNAQKILRNDESKKEISGNRVIEKWNQIE
jgi:hypothetical protein